MKEEEFELLTKFDWDKGQKEWEEFLKKNDHGMFYTTVVTTGVVLGFAAGFITLCFAIMFGSISIVMIGEYITRSLF